jgi:ribosomal protein S18 acetylase RimI-like enzyme
LRVLLQQAWRARPGRDIVPAMTPPLVVRPAVSADGEALGRMGAALARLHHDYDPPRFMLPDGIEAGYRDWLVRELANQKAVVLVAEQAAQLAGYAYGRLEGKDWNRLLDRHGELVDLWVEPGARGAGVGARLGEAAIAELAARGAPRVVLNSAAPNLAAQRLFARLGFRPTMVEMTREVDAIAKSAPRQGKPKRSNR